MLEPLEDGDEPEIGGDTGGAGPERGGFLPVGGHVGGGDEGAGKPRQSAETLLDPHCRGSVVPSGGAIAEQHRQAGERLDEVFSP